MRFFKPKHLAGRKAGVSLQCNQKRDSNHEYRTKKRKKMKAVKKHFKLTEETIEWEGRTLYRIEATRDTRHARVGEKGGFVEKESNLQDSAWVDEGAIVCDNAVVGDRAVIGKYSKVTEHARVFGHTYVGRNTTIGGHAQMDGAVDICEQVEISGNAVLSGSMIVYDKAKISENAQLFGKIVVEGYEVVCGDTVVRGDRGIMLIIQNGTVSEY